MRMRFSEGTASWVRRALSFLCIFLGATFLLYVTDIGCIIRAITGVPCPGCGMTRAWLAFLTGRFDAALAYHPLFWCVPIVLLIPVAQEVFPKAGRACWFLTCAFIVLFVGVWLWRLMTPHDAGLLFCGHVPTGVDDDIIHLQRPLWFGLLPR